MMIIILLMLLTLMMLLMLMLLLTFLDGCTYSKISFTETPSLLIYNGHRLEVTCSGSVTTVTIDKTHGCTVAIPSESVETLSSGSTHLFVSVPGDQGPEV